MKPLEEYMLFTKKGSETVRVTAPAGVRSAQCAVFHTQPRGLDPPKNDSVVSVSLSNQLYKNKHQLCRPIRCVSLQFTIY